MKIKWFGALVALTIAFGAMPAAADQQKWSSQYVQWSPNAPAATDIYNVDQDIWIPKPNNASYWPLQFGIQGVDGGGYIGIQQAWLGPNDPPQYNVRFSIWDAKKAQGANCRPFDGEGIGQTCEIALKLNPNKFYKLRVWKLDDGWWGGWIMELKKGKLVEHLIGKIKAPKGAKFLIADSFSNFVEYYGSAVPKCKQVPLSVAAFTPPAVNYQGSGAYGGYYSYAGSVRATDNICNAGNENMGAFITPKPYDFGFADGVMMFLGQTPDKHVLSPTKYPTPPALPDP
jgi:hypothetical protein